MTFKIIKGGVYSDNRGIVRYVNDCDLDSMRRFYSIEHRDTQVVRAWQGHKSETKCFIPIKGSFIIAFVKIDNFEEPSDELKAEYCILSTGDMKALQIPGGYANGMRALENNSIIGVFSNMSIAQSINDEKRYPSSKWFNWYQNYEKSEDILSKQ